MFKSESSSDPNLLKKLIALEKRVDELCERENDRIPSDVMEDRLKQFLYQEQETSKCYIEAQIVKVKEQLKVIMSEQVQHSMEIKEMKQRLLAMHSLLPEKNGRHLKQPNGIITPIQSRDRYPVGEVGARGIDLRGSLFDSLQQNTYESQSQCHDLAIIKRQVQENSCKLQKVNQDIDKEDFLRKSLLAEHSTKIEALEKNMFNEELKNELKIFSESNKKDTKQMKKKCYKQNNIMIERVKKLEEDMKQSLNLIDTTNKSQNEKIDLCLQKYEEVATQLDKLSFLFDSLNNQCTDLSEKTTELQMDFLRLKDFHDGLSCSDDEPVSKKDSIAIMTKIGLKYELMKTLIIQRVEGLETLRKKLAGCERSIEQRQELSEKLQYLTACVQNLQFFILTQDKSSPEKRREDFEKNWPKSPAQFDLPDSDSDKNDQ